MSKEKLTCEDIMELSLPTYLVNDIEALKEGLVTRPLILDCLFDEVYGSINSAYHGREITNEQAVYLRKKYLGLGDDE